MFEFAEVERLLNNEWEYEAPEQTCSTLQDQRDRSFDFMRGELCGWAGILAVLEGWVVVYLETWWSYKIPAEALQQEHKNKKGQICKTWQLNQTTEN